VQYQATSIRSGVLLLAFLDNDRLGRLARDASRELAKIPVETLSGNLMKTVAGSEEDEGPSAGRSDGALPAAARPGGAAGQTPALDQ
jgi:hypothetical protein